MRTLIDLQLRLQPYKNVEYIHYENLGSIAWHYSTGENIEMLFLEASLGYGALMYVRFVNLLQSRREKPYNSVFAFRRTDNETAKHFYEGLGWQQRDLGWSIYGGAETTIMWIKWEDLVERLQRFSKFDK